jgi:DNA-directed RNA polymerase subunit D
MDVVKKAVKEEEEFRMKITILEKDKLNLTFELSESNETFANTLRRIMISQVPTMAIDEINFFANNSALYDEVLAHRIGLIPLITDLKIYNLKENCKCKEKGCPVCQTTITL